MALEIDVRSGNLNWLYLTLTLVIAAVILFYLFYFGRLLASVLSFFLRTYLWRRHRIWIDIGSIQFSPLGGRLLFRDIRYVGENEQIRVTKGTITWRYWLSKVRHDTDLMKDDTKLPCRTTVWLEGLEWFVYNRGAAFDMLLAKLQAQQDAVGGGLNRHLTADTASVHLEPVENELPKPPSPDDPDAIDWFRESLPIEVQIKNGAAVLGNKSTPSLLIAGFESGIGTCGAVKSRSRLDFYKQVYSFKFAQTRIAFRRNHDYEDSMEAHGKDLSQALSHENTLAYKTGSAFSLRFEAFQEILTGLPAFAERIWNRRTVRSSSTWRGLPRYQEALRSLYEDKKAEIENHQYGKASMLYTEGSIDFTYYADVAGFVPHGEANSEKRRALHDGLEKPDVGNRDLSPEWGIDLRLHGGKITYGPWADRQRVDLQKAFFPAGYFDSEPTSRLRPGDRRLHSALKIFVDFSQTVSLRVPTRESSKDWQHDGLSKKQNHSGEDQAWQFVESQQRKYGWLNVQLGPESSLNFVLPMVAGEAGWDAMLQLHMDNLIISSSVGHTVLIAARTARISCLLPQPLKWEDPRVWTFGISLKRPDINLLRDHTYLFRDLVMDWTCGPMTDPERFVPFTYKMNITLDDYKLGLYLNERNIVDKADIPESNTMLYASGPQLRASLAIPATTYDPPFRTLPIDLEGDCISLSLIPPRWNTHAGFQTDRTKTFGYVEKLNAHIEHTVFAQAASDHVDTLNIELELDGIKFLVLGWVIKYLIEIKENYFGNLVHYTTSQEYRSSHVTGKDRQGNVEQKFRPGQSNIFEVALNLSARRSIALLSQEIYDCQSALVLDIPDFGVHLRNHDYFMELAVNIAPTDLVLVDRCNSVLPLFQMPPLQPNRGWHLDGLTINSHRLFGPQPRTAVYVANWEFSIGLLTMDLTIPDFNALLRVAQAFAITYPDKDNALPSQYALPVDPDVTFLRVDMAGLDATVYTGETTTIHLGLIRGLTVVLDDLAADDWLSHIEVDIPDFALAGQVLQDDEGSVWSEVVSVDTALALALGKTAHDFEARCTTQRTFLMQQDALTKRAQDLYTRRKNAGTDTASVPQLCLFLPSLDVSLPQAVLQSHHRLASQRPASAYARQYKLSTASRNTQRSNTSHTSTTYDPLLRKTFQYRRNQPAGSADGPTFIKQESPVDTQFSSTAPSAVKDALRSSRNRYRPRCAGEVVTHAHIELYRQARLMCCPAAVKVAQDVIMALEKDEDVEHWLDSITATIGAQQERAASKERGNAASVEVSFSIPSLQLSLLQDALRPGDLDMADQLDDPRSDDSTILSSTHLTSRGVNLRFLRCPLLSPFHLDHSLYTIAFASDRSRLQVRHAQDPLRPSHKLVVGLPNTRDGVVLDLVNTGTSLKCQAESEDIAGELSLGDSQLRFVTAAAELITGTVHSWFIVSRAIETTVIEAQYQPAWLPRHLISAIVERTRVEQIASDPPFLSSPTPVEMPGRQQLAWKTLAHLRHRYRRLSSARQDDVRNSLDRPVEESESEQFHGVAYHLQEWHGFELSKPQIMEDPVFRILFPQEAAKSASRLRDRQPVPTSDFQISWATRAVLNLDFGQFEIDFVEGGSVNNSLKLCPSSFSTVYGRSPKSDDMQVHARLTMGDLQATLSPTFLRLVQHVARVRRVFEAKLAPLLPRPPHAKMANAELTMEPTMRSHYPRPTHLPIFLTVILQSAQIRAYAHSIWMRASLVRAQSSLTSTLHFQRHSSVLALDGSSFFACDKASLRADTKDIVQKETDTLDADISGAHESGTLFTMFFTDGYATAVLSEQQLDGTIHASLFGAITSSEIRFPRSILSLSAFVESWREGALPMSKADFVELRRDLERQKRVSAGTTARGPMSVIPPRLEVVVNLVVAESITRIRVSKRMWLGLAVSNFTANASSVLIDGRLRGGDIGASVLQSRLRFAPVIGGRGATVAAWTEKQIVLPSLHTSAQISKGHATVTIGLGRVDFVVTMDFLDTILTGIGLIGHDLDGLLSLLAKFQPKAVGKDIKIDAEPASPFVSWHAQIAVKGLNIGLRGPTATQYIGADLAEATVSQSLAEDTSAIAWRASVMNAALSLVQETNLGRSRSTSSRDKYSFDRSYRLAFFLLDLEASNENVQLQQFEATYDVARVAHLHVRIPKLHAVMQPSALEALDDLVDHVTVELASRKQAKQQELEAIKTSVTQSLDLPEAPSQAKVLPWIERCIFSLQMQNVGIAIPLEDYEIDTSAFNTQVSQKSVVPRAAFILSTASLNFGTSKFSAGFANLRDLSAQFVRAFDQTKPDHFAGLQHESQNRLKFPETELRLTRSGGNARAFNLVAKMQGAKLYLDASIVQSVASLLELYEVGRRRFAKYAEADAVAEDRTSRTASTEDNVQVDTSLVDMTTFEASFSIEEGDVNIYNTTKVRNTSVVSSSKDSYYRAGRPTPSRSYSVHGNSTFPARAGFENLPGTDRFRIPRFSMWAVKKAAKEAGDSSNLHFDARVHATENLLTPELLPFLSGVSDGLKTRMKAIRPPDSPVMHTATPVPERAIWTEPVEPAIPNPPGATLWPAAPALQAIRNLRLSFSLKIDESTLALTCAPRAEVTARLAWKSGGLLLSIHPGERKVNFVMTVDQVEFNLRQQYLNDKCLSGQASGLTMGVTYSQDEKGSSLLSPQLDVGSLDFMLDFYRLEHVLCFKKVWIDHLQDLVPPSVEANVEDVKAPIVERASIALAVAGLARIRSLSAECRLEHGVATTRLLAEEMWMTARRVPGESQSLQIALASVRLTADGQLSGYFESQSIRYQYTFRDVWEHVGRTESQCVAMEAYIGAMQAKIAIDFRIIGLLQANPIKLDVSDDWSQSLEEDRSLRLLYALEMTTLSLITTAEALADIRNFQQKLFSSIEQKRLEADRIVARSFIGAKAERAIRSSVIRSFTKKVRQSVLPAGVRLSSRLHLEAEAIRAVIFKSGLKQTEAMRAQATSVKATLTRSVGSDQAITRDLELDTRLFDLAFLPSIKLYPAAGEPAVVDSMKTCEACKKNPMFTWPPTRINMIGTQAHESNEIHHSFSLRFFGDAAAGYSLSEWERLPQLSRAHTDRLKHHGLAPSATTVPNTPAVDIAAVSPTSSVSAAVQESSLRFVARPGEVHVDFPKLDKLGSATETLFVRWIGAIPYPKMVHRFVTRPLDTIAVRLDEAYQSQIARTLSKRNTNTTDIC